MKIVEHGKEVIEKMEQEILTAQGEADYSHTEEENEQGRWNDNWETTHGEYVIHQGRKHHIYIVRRIEGDEEWLGC